MKQRLDTLLVDRGLAESRSKAQALIMAGKVFSGDRKLTKAGHPVSIDQAVEIRGQDHPWVSRGGLKLEKAISHFAICCNGLTVIDVGASTGGFTDVLLANGASHTYAVDVGRGQLAWRLRQDPRVTVLEKTNARHLSTSHIGCAVDAVVCDASFISLKKILPAPLSFIKPGGFLVALIKPQFEVSKSEVGKGGVVKDPALHQRVCNDIQNWLDGLDHWQVEGIIESPITGPEGNIEFLIKADYHGPDQVRDSCHSVVSCTEDE